MENVVLDEVDRTADYDDGSLTENTRCAYPLEYIPGRVDPSIAGTERGIQEPEATFSACFGEPFLTLSPLTYAEMLKDRVNKHGSKVFLIHTGWSKVLMELESELL